MNASKQVNFFYTLVLHFTYILDFLSKSDYILDDISTILIKSEAPINDELHHFPPHDNSFTNYFSDPDAFNLSLCNEEVVYTEGEAQENVHNKNVNRVKTEFVKHSSDPRSFFG